MDETWLMFRARTSNFSNDTTDQVSIRLLKFLKPVSLLYIIVGATSTIANVLTSVTIIWNKNLHTKSCFLFLTSSICNVLISTHVTIRGCLRYIYFCMEWPLTMTERQCIYREAPLLFAISSGYIIFLIAATDRLLSSVRPVWYMTRNHRCAFFAPISVGLLYIMVEIAVLILGSSKKNLIPICAYGLTTDPNLINGANYRVQTAFCLVIILFTSNIIYIRIQLISSRKKGLNLSKTRKRLQVKITRTLIIMLVSFICTIWAAHVVHLVAETMSNLYNVMIVASFSAVLVSLNGVANLVILTCRYEEFRQGFVKCLSFRYKRQKNGRNSQRTQSIPLISLHSSLRMSFAVE